MSDPSWTERIDEALRRLDGLTAPEAAGKSGLTRGIIYEWRRRRSSGREIGYPVGRHREALERFLREGEQHEGIPLRAPESE